jgi:hypothetical protein
MEIRKQARFFLFLAGLYIVLAVALTWPVALRLRSHVPFYNDTWIFVWDLFWFREAAVTPGWSLYETPLLFHPNGAPLAFHTLTPLNGLLAFPLLKILNLVTVYNLLFLASFVLSALAMAALAFKLTGSRVGAFLAGFLFAFSPYHMAHGYHLNLLSLEALPLFALCFLAFLERPSWRLAAGAAIFAAAAYYSCMEYGFFAFLLAVVLGIHALASGRCRLSRDLIGRGAALGAMTLLFLLPGLIPAIAEAARESYYYDPVDIRFSADLLSWFTKPSP